MHGHSKMKKTPAISRYNGN